MGMEFTQGRTNSLSTLYNLEEEPPKNYSSAPGLTTTDAIFVEKEHMFDKVVTPSDVGKLNRLVIPKQHAEKHFPLDTAANEKGLQLSFEDSTGKPWRFRYSYWNSSQSYVMTKGWSRFVKEKRLGAGDTVSFCRGVGEAGRGRLFIDWRRRPDPAPLQQYQESMLNHRQPFIPWATTAGARVLIPPYECASSSRYQHQYQNYQNHQQHQQIVFYRPHQVAMRPMVLESVPIRNNQVAPGAAKRVRLFGVNLDCPPPGYPGESSTGNNHGISMMNRISSTHGHGYGYLPVPVQNEALPVLQLPTAADTESSLSEKEDCSLDLDL